MLDSIGKFKSLEICQNLKANGGRGAPKTRR